MTRKDVMSNIFQKNTTYRGNFVALSFCFLFVLCCFQKCNSYKIIEILKKFMYGLVLRRCKVGSKSPMIYTVRFLKIIQYIFFI